MAGIATATVRDRLLADRKNQKPDTPGAKGGGVDGTPSRVTYMSGDKLKEAAGYLKSARTALFNWSREVCAGTDRMETDAAHVAEVLNLAMGLEKTAGAIEFKARLYGANGI